MTKPLTTLKTFEHDGQTVAYHDLAAVESVRGSPLSELPKSEPPPERKTANQEPSS